jgi:hypothetical protein
MTPTLFVGYSSNLYRSAAFIKTFDMMYHKYGVPDFKFKVDPHGAAPDSCGKLRSPKNRFPLKMKKYSF